MKSITGQLYAFLTACGGNWRNTLFVPGKENAGWLIAFDRDGCPVVMPAESLCRAAGRQIDPAECRGQLSEAAFKDIFAQYLLWQLPAAGQNALYQLCQL